MSNTPVNSECFGFGKKHLSIRTFKRRHKWRIYHTLFIYEFTQFMRSCKRRYTKNNICLQVYRSRENQYSNDTINIIMLFSTLSILSRFQLFSQLHSLHSMYSPQMLNFNTN